MHNLNNRPAAHISDTDRLEIVRQYRRQVLVRRIRRVAKVAVIATRDDITARQRQVLYYKRRLQAGLRSLHENKYRIVSAGFVALFAVSTIAPSFIQADKNKPIKLDRSVMNLIGETRDDTKEYLKYDSNNKVYSFEATKQDTSSTHAHTGRNADAYTTSLPDKASGGITVTETKTGIPITLIPKFFISEARKSDGDHIVYQSGKKQVIYTHKYNGLKEDIILPSPQNNDPEFSFTLRLPVGAEARLDKDGNVDIYSSDPTLFGDISYGSDTDRSRVEKARENGEKNNLVMSIPYPVVKDSEGNEYTTKAKFELGDKRKETTKQKDSKLPADAPEVTTNFNTYTLTLRTSKLQDLSYPISVDPTIQVGSASDFAKLNNDTNATVDTTNSLIKRGSLTGGFTNAWTSNTNHLPYAAQKHGAVIYNGYLYIHGGLTATGNDYRVYSAPIDPTTGSIGKFTAVSAVVGSGRSTHAIFIYNGYFYIVGSGNSGNPVSSPAALYAKLNADGTIGTFTSTTSMQTGRRFASFTLSNGYIYVAGGCTAFASAVESGDCTSFASTTEYAQIKPDGTLSAWQTTAALPAANRMLGSMTSYNGALYYAGGEDDGDLINNAVSYTSVYMARQNSDGTLNTWAQLNAMPAGRNSQQSFAYGGYLYEVGGYTTASYVAAINADGTIGSWMTNTALPFTNAVGVMLGSNNYLYIVGGATPNTGDEILVTDLNAAGSTPGWTQDSGTSYSTARRRHGVAVYNGYLYIAGGCGVSSCGSGDALSDVQYAPLNADGSVGTWAATSSLTTQRAGCSIAIYNGVMYVSGGFQNLLQIFTTSVDRAVINANGTLGTFTADTNNFSQGRSQHTSVAYNGFLYIIGGRDTQNSAFATVERASINASDGSLGVFSLDAPLGTRRAMGKAVVSGGRIYMIGGCTDFTGGSGCTAATNTIEIASIANNGSLTWSGNPTNYPFTLSSSVSYALKGYMYVFETGNLKFAPINPVDGTIGSTWTSLPGTVDHGETYSGDMYNDYLYVAGGFSAGTRVDYAQIQNGGTGGTSSWTTGSSINPRANHNVVALNGYIYVLGGACSGVTGCTSSMSTQVQYGTINASTGAVTWATASNGISVRKNASAFAYNGRLYVLGGCTNSACNAYTRTIQYVAPNASTGNITTAWTTNTANIPSDNVGVAFIPYDGYVYRIGGNVNAAGRTATTEYTTIDATTGAIGSTWTASSLLNNATTNNRLVVYGGYIYTVGGVTAGAVELNVVESSKIQANHSLGAWSLVASLPTARQSTGLVVLNGFIYIIGGYRSGANRLKDVQYAAILGNGRIGAWQATTSLNVVKAELEAVVVNGRAYVPGGSDNSSNPLSDVEYGTLNVIPREASFSRLYDFDAGVRPTKLITRGVKQTGSVTPTTYSTNNAATGTTTLDNTQSISDIGYTGSNATTINLGTNRTLSRYLFLQYTIDDSLSATFPDTGTESTITDFDMYYTSNPGTRLRGGRTFTNGVDRGLDAQPQ